MIIICPTRYRGLQLLESILINYIVLQYCQFHSHRFSYQFTYIALALRILLIAVCDPCSFTDMFSFDTFHEEKPCTAQIYGKAIVSGTMAATGWNAIREALVTSGWLSSPSLILLQNQHQNWRATVNGLSCETVRVEPLPKKKLASSCK